jgi:lipoprotein-releasing system permease protein
MGVVAISVTLIIFLGSLIMGLQGYLIETITGVIPNIVMSQPERLPIALWQVQGARRPGTVYVGKLPTLEQRERKIDDWQIWIDRLPRLDNEIVAVSPSVEDNAILSSGANRKGVLVTGAVPNRFNQIVNVQKDIRRGTFLGMQTGDISIGRPVAEDLNVDLGDRVRLTTSTGDTATYKVAGIFMTGAQPVDEGTVYLPLRDAQSLFGLGNAVTSIGVRLRGVFDANAVAARLRTQVPYKVDSWMEQNQNLLAALRSQTQSVSLILSFTVLASGFAIASILITAVTSKLQEIGILRAIGATRRQIIGLFTLQSTLMAVMGAIVGAGLGIALSIVTYQTRVRTSATGLFEEVFPIKLSPQLILGAMAVAVVVGFVASIYPAWKASKVNPIEVIRGG